VVVVTPLFAGLVVVGAGDTEVEVVVSWDPAGVEAVELVVAHEVASMAIPIPRANRHRADWSVFSGLEMCRFLVI
jgi:hypothetical protein